MPNLFDLLDSNDYFMKQENQSTKVITTGDKLLIANCYFVVKNEANFKVFENVS